MKESNWVVYWNSHSNGGGNVNYSPVCTCAGRQEPILLPVTQPPCEEFRLGTAGSSVCSTESVSEEECLEAARRLTPEGQVPAHNRLTPLNHAGVPPGCSMKESNWVVYWNSHSNGGGNVNYSPVCTCAERHSSQDEVMVHLETAGSSVC